MHALPARPHNMVGGRGSDTYADGTIKINLISLCSHTDAHPNPNREVCHSLTWHSSESKSALERFEPVAAAMLWSDGQGTLFAPVAARRQKVFKRGIDTYGSMCVGVAETGVKAFLFLSFSFFSDKRKEHYKKSIIKKLLFSRTFGTFRH